MYRTFDMAERTPLENAVAKVILLAEVQGSASRFELAIWIHFASG
jgi:hypothetical protein